MDLLKLVPVGEGDLSHPEVKGAVQLWKLAEENLFLCGGGAFKYSISISELVSYFSFVLFIHR